MSAPHSPFARHGQEGAAPAEGAGASPFGFGAPWSGFGQGFDFFQQLTRGAAQQAPPGMPPLASWLTPTLDADALDKRIDELKTVQFWLEQNTRAIVATIQALEVQKLTIESLRRMNMNMADLAENLRAAAQPKPAPAWPGTRGDADEAAAAEPPAAAPSFFADRPAPETVAEPEGDAAAPDAAATEAASASAPGADPLAWWSALGQQFQAIAQQALRGASASATAAPDGSAESAPAADAESTSTSASRPKAAGGAAPPTARRQAVPKKAASAQKAAKPRASASGAGGATTPARPLPALSLIHI